MVAGRARFYTAPMNRLRRHPAAATAAFVVGFLLFRAGLFAFTTAGEYRLYRDYGEAARATSLADLYRTRDVEYPQLAVALCVLPAVFADALPAWSTRLVRWRPNKLEPPYTDESPGERDAGDRYEVALGLVLVAVDVACLVLVYVVARRVYPAEDHVARLGRLAAYAVAVGALGLIVYDRLDLVVGLAALLALWAIAAGRPVAGYALLAVGTAYKLVPVLLLPVWVLAAAAVRAAPGATPGRFVRAVAREAAVAAAVLAVWPVATYLCGGGERAFGFLTYHARRGLQLEAPVAWPVAVFGPSAAVAHGYGSYNLSGDPADAVAAATRSLMPLAVLVGVAVSARGFWRVAAGPGTAGIPPALGSGRLPPGGGGAGGTPAVPGYAAVVPHVVAASVLLWLGFIVANKVGSPQYLLWVAALVPLLPRPPLRTRAARGWAVLLLVAMILTTAIYPCCYDPDILGPVTAYDPFTRRGPNALGLFLLAAKSVTLAGATAWLAVAVWRTPAPEPTP